MGAYADCAHAPDPARRLLERAVRQGVDGGEEIVEEAVVALGAPELARVVDRDDPRDRASVVLAAALVRDADPLADPTVRAAMVAAGDDAEVLRSAVGVADMRVGGCVARPAGLLPVLSAAEAHAEGAPWSLIALADVAFVRGYPEEGLDRLRRVAARGDATPEIRAHLAQRLLWRGEVDEARRLVQAGGCGLRLEADIGMRLLARGHDPDAVVAVVRELECDLGQTGASHVVWPERLTPLLRALAGVGERAQVRRMGELYLARARAPRPHEGPAKCADWAAMASDAFRIAGDREAAVAAAREGMEHVGRLVAKWTRRLEAGNPDARVRAEYELRFMRAAPARALYRAGLVDEALATGRIRAMDRYDDALDTGVETPDVGWVIAEQDLAGLDEIKRRLIEAGDRAGAGALYEALLTAEWDRFDGSEFFWAREWGKFAAAAGRAEAMRDHFVAAAAELDEWLAAEPDAAGAVGLAALQLACDWRRGEVLLAGGT